MLWWRRKSRELDLEREIDSHIELEAEEQRESGHPPSDATRAARRALGNPTLVKETTREQWGWTWLETLGKDLHYAARVLRKNAAFSFVAIAALALGIGLNTAIFALVNAALLRPLPFANPHQLVRLWDTYGTPGNFGPVSYPNFRDWRAWNHSFQNMAAITRLDFVLTGTGDAVHVGGTLASASFFEVLGVQPMLGRRFLPEEDRPPASGANVIIISHKLWKERLGGDPKVLGRTLTLDRNPFTIVGVMPPSFDSNAEVSDSDFWLPAALLAESSGASKPVSEERSMSFLHVIGRLKPGISLTQAQADMDAVAVALVRAYPADDPKEGVSLLGLQESNTSDSRPTLLLLFGAAAVVLLIACADVGGLVLARATGRHREMTVRAAIGAGRWRIIRQLLVEGLLLTTIGCLAGLLLATAAVPLLTRVLGLPPAVLVTIDDHVLGFALVMGMLATVVFSLAPALQSTKLDLIEGLKESSLNTSESRRHRMWNNSLVIGQVALAMVLLSSAALLTVSLIRLQRLDLGFAPDHVLTFPIGLAGDRYRQDQRASFFEELISRLQTLPGVVSAGASGYLPMSGNMSRTALDNVGGRAIPVAQRTGIVYASVTPGYFETVGIQIQRGRGFLNADRSGSPPVVIINQAEARLHFGSTDPIGQQIEPGMWNGAGSTTQPRTIVGVARDVKQSLRDRAEPSIYWPVAQIPSESSMYVTVRTTGDPLRMVSAVRSVLRSMDKDIPLYNVQPLTHYVSTSLRAPRDTATLVALFAMLALVLTAVGLYGVISYSVARRTREIGVRMALGARSSSLVRGIVGRGLVLALLGAVIGLPAAIAGAKLFQSLLFGVSPQEPSTLVAGAVVLIVVALAASYIPARRAARVDPLTTLRYQ